MEMLLEDGNKIPPDDFLKFSLRMWKKTFLTSMQKIRVGDQVCFEILQNTPHEIHSGFISGHQLRMSPTRALSKKNLFIEKDCC